MSGELFGVRIDAFPSRDALAERFRTFLGEPRTHTVFTLNPEILIAATRDPRFAETLNGADLNLIDGFGLSLAILLRKGVWLTRYPGIDAAEMLLGIAAEQNIPVVLLGGKQGSGRGAAEALKERLPRLEVHALGEDLPFTNDGVAEDRSQEESVAAAIAACRPAIILVGLGAPKQERWIATHRHSFPSVRLMMAVGGALDIWSGRFRRAPKWMRSAGLEWFWRFLEQPSRLPRTLRATVVFPLMLCRANLRYERTR